jgi:hypothetical protein
VWSRLTLDGELDRAFLSPSMWADGTSDQLWLSAAERRCHAVLPVKRGEPKIVMAAPVRGLAPNVHTWSTRYARCCLAGLPARTYRRPWCPSSSPRRGRNSGRASFAANTPLGVPTEVPMSLARIVRENATTLVSFEARSTVSVPVHRIYLLSWRYGSCRPQEPGGNAVQISVRSGDLMSFGYCGVGDSAANCGH